MKNTKKKQQLIISIGLIILLIFAVVGISYAAFKYVGRGEKVNQITTGTISMNYEESSNVISINNALPTTDETGKKRLVEGEYFDFSVTTNITGNAAINWEIAAEDFDDNTLRVYCVKYYLTKLVGGEEIEVNPDLPKIYRENKKANDKTGRPANMMSLLVGTENTQGEVTTNYRLRLYVDELYNPQGDGGNLVFKTKINVYGKVNTEIEELPLMKNYEGTPQGFNADGTDWYFTEDFHIYEYKNKITSAVIKTDTLIPETAVEIINGKGNYWDVSYVQDNSVIAYLEENGTTEYYDGTIVPTYKLTIGGNGGVSTKSTDYLFAGFGYLEDIDISHLDTSKVTSMQAMFDSCINLTVLDVSNFDTANVTDMSGMFNGCRELTNLNLSSFDTSQVTNMSTMFQRCSKLVEITVSDKWLTENADTMAMFNYCGTDHVTII